MLTSGFVQDFSLMTNMRITSWGFPFSRSLPFFCGLFLPESRKNSLNARRTHPAVSFRFNVAHNMNVSERRHKNVTWQLRPGECQILAERQIQTPAETLLCCHLGVYTQKSNVDHMTTSGPQIHLAIDISYKRKVCTSASEISWVSTVEKDLQLSHYKALSAYALDEQLSVEWTGCHVWIPHPVFKSCTSRYFCINKGSNDYM